MQPSGLSDHSAVGGCASGSGGFTEQSRSCKPNLWCGSSVELRISGRISPVLRLEPPHALRRPGEHFQAASMHRTGTQPS
ncbi:hypothetical protein GBF38_015975 [Nibea albiflora]|uniref:Uncharacterized protein n=1 Tax=Nibea albiflora TaxID=240163 RepID=A0ACB7FIG3_NIBAL|nr:hypothetical protein GBF38_015975 [Nibea albiflora]